jgi:hypothetical protein
VVRLSFGQPGGRVVVDGRRPTGAPPMLAFRQQESNCFLPQGAGLRFGKSRGEHFSQRSCLSNNSDGPRRMLVLPARVECHTHAGRAIAARLRF